MKKTLKGIGASDGIALGKALIIAEPELKITDGKVTDVNSEVEKFNKAVKTTVDDLDKLKTIADKKLGAEKAAIFEAHKEIAQDPQIADEVIAEIKNNKSNAAFAVNMVADKYHEMFKNMDDPYFKERASDVQDVSSRIIKHILGINIVDLSTIDEEVIIIADDLTPSQTAQLDKKFVQGFATNIGGRTSHAAIMARSLEIPAVLGTKTITSEAKDGELIAINGATGEVMLGLTDEDVTNIKKAAKEFAEEKERLKTYIDKPSITKDGHEVKIEANIGKPADVDAVVANGGEGIGLFRSEFLYMESDHFPTEEEQFTAYKAVVDQMKGKLVVIRTLDIGGDKKLSYYQFQPELNPFLGFRAIRFCLANKDIFKQQLRALLRASAFGPLGIMFPMIATLDEFNEAKGVVEECKKELKKEGIKYDENVQVGMMVEIPAAAINADKFAEVSDFFSIGTNDLIQYSMAAGRQNQKVSYLYQPTNPSILKLVKMTIDGGHKHNRWIGMCGEMAGDVNAIPLLLGMGLDAFSMSATSMLRARSIIDSLNYSDAQALADKALNMSTTGQVQDLVQKFLKENGLK